MRERYTQQDSWEKRGYRRADGHRKYPGATSMEALLISRTRSKFVSPPSGRGDGASLVSLPGY